MSIDIDEMQRRIELYYRQILEIPTQFDLPGDGVGPQIIHLTQKVGALADAFVDDNDKMVNAVSEIIVVSLFVLTLLKQQAGGVLKTKVLKMEGHREGVV